MYPLKKKKETEWAAGLRSSLHHSAVMEKGHGDEGREDGAISVEIPLEEGESSHNNKESDHEKLIPNESWKLSIEVCYYFEGLHY